MVSQKVSVYLTVLLLGLGMGAGFAMQGKQPHMRVALHSLETARAQLSKAGADKNGRRAAALSLVSQAIREIKTDMAAGSRNGRGIYHP